MKPVIVVTCVVFVLVLVKGKVCPGGQTCKGTCCELPSGRQGCCPYNDGVCCKDKVHCCPHGYDCLTSRCKKRGEDSSEELMVDTEEEAIPANSSSIICPDTSECGDSETCCPIGGDRYGCCPMSGAQCCSDLKTCCPHGYSCVAGGCQLDQEVFKPVKILPKSVVCPGGRYRCPDYNTCCRSPTGWFGCCPIYHAVCCRDGRHCCPSGYTCDPYSARCNKS